MNKFEIRTQEKKTAIVSAALELFKEKGLVRSVVVLSSPTIAMQFKRIAQEEGIYAWERYIDSSQTTNWEEVGKKWIVDGIDPGK